MIKNYQEVLAEDDTVSDHSGIVPFWAAAPKGTKSCRTRGESVRLSVCLPSLQDALLVKFSFNTMEK